MITMSKHHNRKLCDWCSKNFATLLAKQPSKGNMVFDVCYRCWERYQRYHYDTVTVMDDDVIGIDEGKPVIDQSIFPNKQVLIRYKLDLRNV